MAKEIDVEIVPGVMIESTYWLVASVTLSPLDHTGVIVIRGYLNKDSRSQQIPTERLPRFREHKEIDSLRYQKYFAPSVLQAAGNDPIAAAYLMLTNEPPPVGLKEFAEGKDV
jgi:hypothetical protein